MSKSESDEGKGGGGLGLVVARAGAGAARFFGGGGRAAGVSLSSRLISSSDPLVVVMVALGLACDAPPAGAMGLRALVAAAFLVGIKSLSPSKSRLAAPSSCPLPADGVSRSAVQVEDVSKRVH